MIDKTVTTAQAAEMLGRSVSCIRHYVLSGKLKQRGGAVLGKRKNRIFTSSIRKLKPKLKSRLRISTYIPLPISMKEWDICILSPKERGVAILWVKKLKEENPAKLKQLVKEFEELQ